MSYQPRPQGQQNQQNNGQQTEKKKFAKAEKLLAQTVTGAKVEVWDFGEGENTHVSAKARTYEAWVSQARYVPPFDVVAFRKTQLVENMWEMEVELLLHLPAGSESGLLEPTTRKAIGLTTFTMGPVMKTKDVWIWNPETRRKEPTPTPVDTNTNFLEKAQTQAISKALGNMGYGYVIGLEDTEESSNIVTTADVQEKQQGMEFCVRKIDAIRRRAKAQNIEGQDDVVKDAVVRYLGPEAYPLPVSDLAKVSAFSKENLKGLMVELDELNKSLAA